MATERVTEHPDGSTDRVVERDSGTTYVDRGGSGVGGVIIGIAVLALVAIVAFFMLSANRHDLLPCPSASCVRTPASVRGRGVDWIMPEAMPKVLPNPSTPTPRPTRGTRP